MFKVRLSDFRCFAGDAPPVEVLPITFLVGENSAGKTTFMAAARLLLESLKPAITNPFNREPYRLGGFEQISHYRGGGRGRAERFCLELLVPPSDAPAPRGNKTESRHKFTFMQGSRGSPQPELARYEFATADITVTLNLEGKEPVVRLLQEGEERLNYKPDRVSITLLRRDLTYLRYIFQDISYGRQEGIPPATGRWRERVYRHFVASMRFLAMDVFASAPVRTEPLRNYAPSEILASAEGAHVPLEMARQKKSSPEDWKHLHDALAFFGKKSGLFDDINIRSLGKKDGDPFQLTVKIGGPAMNIADVGYGVSQALPIIYQLEQAKQYDAFFLQQPEVHLHPRAQAELGTLIARVSKQRPATKVQIIETHSDYIIDRVRMEVAAKRIDHKNVTIVFFHRGENGVVATNIYLDAAGDIVSPPENFRAFFLEEHRRLLGI